MKITKGLAGLDEALPYLNRIFRENFPKLLPKLYTDNTYLPDHYVCRDDNGEFMGALASIPVELEVGDDKLDCRGIGMVGVRKKFRGLGVMSNLLDTAIADAERENVDYMFLGGKRQRYEHYGFVPTGTAYEFVLNKDNIRYTHPDVKAYSFELLRCDSPYLEKVIEIYESQDVKYTRKDFYKTLTSWNAHKNYAVLNRAGEAVGHICYHNAVICDFCVGNADAAEVIAAFLTQKCSLWFVKVNLYPNRPDLIKRLSEVCESCKVFNPAEFRIINYKHVLEVLLNRKAKKTGGADYSVVMEIKNNCRLKIQKSGNSVSVEDTTEIPGYVFDSAEAAYSIFSPHMSDMLGLPFNADLFMTTQDDL